MGDGVKDREDELFERKLAQRNHQDLMAVLGKVLSRLSQDKDTAELEEIREQTKEIRALAAALKEPPEKEAQEINVTVDNQEIVTSLQKIVGEFTDAVGRLEKAINGPKEKVEWEFQFKRNPSDFIQSPIKAIQK